MFINLIIDISGARVRELSASKKALIIKEIGNSVRICAFHRSLDNGKNLLRKQKFIKSINYLRYDMKGNVCGGELLDVLREA